MPIFYEPIYDDRGVRIPRFALEGPNAMGGLGQEADGALVSEVVRDLSTQARSVRSDVDLLGLAIRNGTATSEDVTRVRLNVINFSQDVGRYMPLLQKMTPEIVASLDASRKTLLPTYAEIEASWQVSRDRAASLASQLASTLKTMAGDLADSATLVAYAAADAVKAVGSGAANVVNAVGDSMKNMSKGLGLGMGLLPIALAAAAVGVGYIYLKPKRSRT